jgi:MAM domain.
MPNKHAEYEHKAPYIPGYYMYAEASGPARKMQKASLISKSFRGIPNRCITFFYSMYGMGIGALRLYVKTTGSDMEREIWSKEGEQGKGWLEAEVDFSSQFAYQVICRVHQNKFDIFVVFIVIVFISIFSRVFLTLKRCK